MYKKYLSLMQTLFLGILSLQALAETPLFNPPVLIAQSANVGGEIKTNIQPDLYSNAPTLDLTLSQLEYPYRVKYFESKVQGVYVKTAYMDVAAQGNEHGVVLLFHGKNFSSDYWGTTIADLTRAGYRVIAPDQIGFGKSSKPRIKFHFDELCENTFKLLDQLKIRQVNVIANSMGGMVGVRFTVLYPSIVKKLILENPIGLEDYSKNIPPQTYETLLKLEMAQTEASYRKFMQSYFPNWRPEFDRFVENYVRIKNGPDYEEFSMTSARTYQMIADQPVVGDFEKINQPTLLIIGQLDHTVFGKRFAPPEAVKTMGDFTRLGKEAASMLKNSKLIEIPNAGHVPHLEVHDQFMRDVINFLD